MDLWIPHVVSVFLLLGALATLAALKSDSVRKLISAGPLKAGLSVPESAAAIEERAMLLHPKGRPFLVQVKAFYDAQLQAHPYLTNFCVACTISSMANIVAQTAENSSPDRGFAGVGAVDFHETQALAMTSGVYSGFFLTFAFKQLGRHFPGSDWKSILCKLAIAQLCFQPFVYVPYFFMFHGMLAGESPALSFDHLEHGYFATLFRMWALYCPGRLFMFACVPVQYQVLWDCCVSFCWQLILSFFNISHHPAAASPTFAPAIATLGAALNGTQVAMQLKRSQVFLHH